MVSLLLSKLTINVEIDTFAILPHCGIETAFLVLIRLNYFELKGGLNFHKYYILLASYILFV